MTTRAVVLLAAAAVAGCTWLAPERPRALPGDRGAELTYVALGDSTVEGIGATSPEAIYVHRLWERLRAVYPRARLVNLGVAGATSADVIAAQLRRAIDLRPHLVTLSIGPNDVTGRVTAEQYARNIDTILRALVRETDAVVVVNLLPDLAVTPRFRAAAERDAVGRQTALFNEALARTCRAHRVEVVDLYAPSRAEVPSRPELVAADGYHPSDAGHARWAELMWTGVDARIRRR
ncbi:MAG: SGNH/GDSL hydrolase family protein [Candidatus Rokubacteria bacterium]|nr:SGNH/GDSL hydrolase family protein [Candidatus Rokubacteria bacterium]